MMKDVSPVSDIFSGAPIINSELHRVEVHSQQTSDRCGVSSVVFPLTEFYERAGSKVHYPMSDRILHHGHLRYSELHGVEVQYILYFPAFLALFPSQFAHVQVRSKIHSPMSDVRSDARSELRRVKDVFPLEEYYGSTEEQGRRSIPHVRSYPF